jgi:hypothetical protein
VTPLELWDFPVGSGVFAQKVGALRVAELRQRRHTVPEVAELLAADLLEVASLFHRLQPGTDLQKARSVAGFDLLYLTGGLTELEGFREASGKGTPAFRVAFGKEGRFGGESGGELLLTEQGQRGGLIVDVGQTAIKCSVVSQVGGRTARRLYERDERALPPETAESGMRISGERARRRADAALAWVAESVTESLATGPPAPAALVLALPCALDAGARPGSSTYTGWEGDHTLVDRLLEALGERVLREPSLTFHPWRHAEQIEVFVLNDAELAALSARAEGTQTKSAKTLVLTIGFGPGAALLEPIER